MFFYSENDKTDLDVIRENHRFLWREDDEADMNWYLELLHKTVILDHFVPSLYCLLLIRDCCAYLVIILWSLMHLKVEEL